MEPDAVRTAFEGSLVRVDLESWDGREYEVVRHPGAVGIVAILPDDEVLLVRQTRRPVRETLLEIPAGLLDIDGEEASAAAARELFEETGHRASSVEPLGRIYTSPGFTDEAIELFVADAAPEPEAEPEDGIEVVRRPLADLARYVLHGGIPDAKTAVAVLLVDARRSPA